ncbi:hypothetical protein OROGR_011508 [Orobanche gracilis]
MFRRRRPWFIAVGPVSPPLDSLHSLVRRVRPCSNGTQRRSSKTLTKDEAGKTGVWSCPICTYDNEDSMSACEICGVLRHPLVKVNTKSNSAADPLHAVGGICKDSGASVMAKSLFASLPQHMAKKSIIIEAQNDVACTDHLNSHKHGHIRGTFQELNSAFISQNHRKLNIGWKSGNVPREREVNILVASESDAKGSEFSSASVTVERHNKVHENASASFSKKKSDVSGSSKISESSSSKTVEAEIIHDEKAELVREYYPETWTIPNKVDGELCQLNLAIVGHVDSGKSTLSGRLLHLLGRISHKEMNKNEIKAKQQGKGSFAYAWALDEGSEERERGITMNVAVAFFTSRKYRVVLLDSPGHRDFVPNMISGASQADAAIIVIDASVGSFEAGIDAVGGQTREHVQLIRSFGVDQIIVVVNKMDVVEYSKERFNEVKEKLGTFLRSCGFKGSSILWIPASAMENQNLVTYPSDGRLSWTEKARTSSYVAKAVRWFKGTHLLDAIDSLQPPARDYSKPLLMPICDVFKSQSQGGVSVYGKLESGATRTGFKVLVMPSREIATVRSLERDSQPCSIARAGDNVMVNLQGIEGNRVTAGSVICHPDYPIVQVAHHLELKILVLDVVSTPIVISSQVVLEGPVCVEEYSNCRSLGRVFLRSSGRTVALGIVTRIINEEEY